MSEKTLTKEMSPSTDQHELELKRMPYRQVVESLLCWSRDCVCCYVVLC